MRKLSYLSMVLVVGLLGGCGTDTNKKDEATSQSDSNTEVANEKVEEQEGVKEQTDTKPKKEVEEQKVLNQGEVEVIDNIGEVLIKGHAIQKNITPPNPGNYYTYYENKEPGQIYVDVVLQYKNLETTSVSADDIASIKVYYDDKYEFPSFSTIEENGGADFTYSNIVGVSPLQTATLHYLASLPEEIEVNDKPLKAVISVGNEKFEYQIR